MNEKEKIALKRYQNSEKPFVSTFIDEDTIIVGYGKLDYDFEYPLPSNIIKDIYGTTSWDEWFKLKGLHRYETINKEGVVTLTPYISHDQVEHIKNNNPDYQIIKI
jgi:hypothetical protein